MSRVKMKDTQGLSRKMNEPHKFRKIMMSWDGEKAVRSTAPVRQDPPLRMEEEKSGNRETQIQERRREKVAVQKKRKRGLHRKAV